MGDLKARAIPYNNFRQRMIITRKEIAAGRNVSFDKENVYSFPRESKISKNVKKKHKPLKLRYKNSGASKTFENLKCNSCNSYFRIIALDDIQWSVCPRCGGVNIDELSRREEYEFENKIR